MITRVLGEEMHLELPNIYFRKDITSEKQHIT